MPLESILQAIEADCATETESILQHAHSEADSILKAAANAAEESRKSCLKKREKELQNASKQILVQAKRKADRIKLETANRIFTQTMEEAESLLKTCRSNSDYPHFLRRAIFEIVDEVDAHRKILHCDPRDLDCVQTIAGDRVWHVIADLDCSGGVEIESEDGRQRISNTLETRLRSVAERYSHRVAYLLASQLQENRS